MVYPVFQRRPGKLVPGRPSSLEDQATPVEDQVSEAPITPGFRVLFLEEISRFAELRDLRDGKRW